MFPFGFDSSILSKGHDPLMGFLSDVDNAGDEATSQYCGQGDCIVVWPELIGSHRPAGGLVGGINKVSDTGNRGEYREEGSSGNVVNSAILAALNKWGPRYLMPLIF